GSEGEDESSDGEGGEKPSSGGRKASGGSNSESGGRASGGSNSGSGGKASGGRASGGKSGAGGTGGKSSGGGGSGGAVSETVLEKTCKRWAEHLLEEADGTDCEVDTEALAGGCVADAPAAACEEARLSVLECERGLSYSC